MLNNFLKIFLLFILLFISYIIFSQETKQIDIVHAISMEFDESIGDGAKRLLGNVVFKHEGAYMFCDSAYFFHNINTAIAYSNVRIKQGDSILFVSKYMEYDGNLKQAKMRDSVVLKHNHSYLLTDSLDYDRSKDLAYYFNGGKIFDGDNKLSSRRGYYYTKFKDYVAVDTVTLRNPQYIINSDTLKYNTESQIAYFFGPTNIVSDSNYIYCENGYYNTNLDVASFSKESWIRSGSNYLKGDSLYYDRKIRFGEGFNNVSIIDTVENIIALGDYGYFYESPENALLTKKAQVIFVNENDSIYMHSDTVRINVDTLDNKLIRAFRKVQIYKSDIQGRCDSLTFHSLDSVAHMYYNPIIWAEGNKQITADHIYVCFENKEPKTFYFENNAYLIENLDSTYFNQAKSDIIKGNVKDKELNKVDLIKNCQTIFFVVDEETEEITALNILNSVDMELFLTDKKIDVFWYYGKPDGVNIPIKNVTKNDMFFKNFIWLDEYRPKTKEDIFNWRYID